MSVVRLYFDADSMERAVVSGLRARGIDASSALEVGMADSSDEEQLEFARTEGRVTYPGSPNAPRLDTDSTWIKLTTFHHSVPRISHPVTGIPQPEPRNPCPTSPSE